VTAIEIFYVKCFSVFIIVCSLCIIADFVNLVVLECLKHFQFYVNNTNKFKKSFLFKIFVCNIFVNSLTIKSLINKIS
jgi:hypothetical protein